VDVVDAHRSSSRQLFSLQRSMSTQLKLTLQRNKKVEGDQSPRENGWNRSVVWSWRGCRYRRCIMERRMEKNTRKKNLKKNREDATTPIDLSQVKYYVEIHFRVGLHMTFISRYLCQKKSNIWNTSATNMGIFSTSTIKYFCRYFHISYTNHRTFKYSQIR